MPTPRTPPKRRQRAHEVLPAGFAWRDGRPRWIPSPTRRKQGWKALDLKDGWGKWLAKGPAVARAEAIAAAVAAWANGQPVPSPFVHIAPKGAELKGAVAGELKPRAIGALLEDYYASPAFTMDLKENTRVQYRSSIGRLLGAVASPEPPRQKDGRVDRAALAAKLDVLKAMDVDLFRAPLQGEGGAFTLEDAYDHLRRTAGDHVAYGAMRSTSAWLGWVVRKKRIWPSNPCELIEVKPPKGRIRVASWEELTALVTTADAMGWRSIGDAVILGVDLSWSQQDLLSLMRTQVDGALRAHHRRIKTGVMSSPPLLAIGRARLAEIYAREWPGAVQPLNVVACEGTGQDGIIRRGQAWDRYDFRHRFLEVKREATKREPTLETLKFLDLRDTAITYGWDAGLEIEEICSRSQHTLKHAWEVIRTHYGEIRQAVADRAAGKLDAHFAKMGYSFGARLGA